MQQDGQSLLATLGTLLQVTAHRRSRHMAGVYKAPWVTHVSNLVSRGVTCSRHEKSLASALSRRQKHGFSCCDKFPASYHASIPVQHIWARCGPHTPNCCKATPLTAVVWSSRTARNAAQQEAYTRQEHPAAADKVTGLEGDKQPCAMHLTAPWAGSLPAMNHKPHTCPSTRRRRPCCHWQCLLIRGAQQQQQQQQQQESFTTVWFSWNSVGLKSAC
jgi:hypothetical protein